MGEDSPEVKRVRMAERFKQMEEKLDLILKIFQGEGNESNPGFLIRMDRLEQSDKFRKKVLWLLASCVLGLVLEQGWSLVTHMVRQGEHISESR